MQSEPPVRAAHFLRRHLSALLSGFTGVPLNAAILQPCRRRPAFSAAPGLPSSVGADTHVGPFIRFHRTTVLAATPQLCLRRPAFSAAPGLPSSVGADAHIGPLGTDEFAADFRENGAYCAGRCRHRPLQTYVKNKQGGLCPQGVCRIRSAPLSLTAAQSRPPPTNMYNRT